MQIRVRTFLAMGGAALILFAVAPVAMAKSKDSGSNAVQCLANDSALQTAENISNPLTGPVTVSISPASLWPPNHKMRTEGLSASLTQAFSPNPPSGTYASGADISVYLVDITDDQIADDVGGGHGCGKPEAKQGPDWTPAAVLSDATSYDLATATLTDTSSSALDFVDQTDATVDVQLRGERCARDGARLYTVSVVCCDTTAGAPKIVCDDPAIQDALNQPTALPTPSITDDLTVTVPKSRRHKGKP
jgi:hypothetical protein